MADCECLAGCIFFNDKMQNMPSMSQMFKRDYCRNDFESCARHMAFKALGRESVPVDMFPNMVERAKQIISRT